jgi:hypothetical protein
MTLQLLSSTSTLALTRSWRPQPTEVLSPPPDHCCQQDTFVASPQPQAPQRQPFSLLDHLNRVPTKCWNCAGSGKCQQDYPGAGSGKGSNGEKEYYCSGSGKCYTCAGSGWIYTRTYTLAA